MEVRLLLGRGPDHPFPASGPGPVVPLLTPSPSVSGTMHTPRVVKNVQNKIVKALGTQSQGPRPHIVKTNNPDVGLWTPFRQVTCRVFWP